ncbi:MAG: type III pantothenate kinase [Bacteroidia bacterium]|nr:type III pantothenate kinase [Bacteroidia bacterium]
MELVIDIGNSKVKAAIFINNGIHKVFRSENADNDLKKEVRRFNIRSIIISTVRNDGEEMVGFWSDVAPVYLLDYRLPLPVSNLYETPKTLGNDRIAAVVGARFLFPAGPVLAIDAGTCITFDILTEDDVYLGGNIAPGIRLRFEAMHSFTHALPLVENYEIDRLYGRTTEESMSTGVVNGIAGEIDSVIRKYEEEFPGLKTVICGGELRYFVNHLKKEIFANQNLVLLGLHKILKFNEQKRS